MPATSVFVDAAVPEMQVPGAAARIASIMDIESPAIEAFRVIIPIEQQPRPNSSGVLWTVSAAVDLTKRAEWSMADLEG